MMIDKTTDVAIIYNSSPSSARVIQNCTKLQSRLQHAIEDMVEDGFTNYILPIEQDTPFLIIAIKAILAEKAIHPSICFTILFPFELEPGFETSVAERNHIYTQYADNVIFGKRERTEATTSNLIQNLIEQSGAIIGYHEQNCSQLYTITHRAHRLGCPFININI